MKIQSRIQATFRTLISGSALSRGHNVCFIHVPKSGGTSVSVALQKALAGRTIHEINTLSSGRVSDEVNRNIGLEHKAQLLARINYRKGLAAYFMQQEGGCVYGHFSVDPIFMEWFSNNKDYTFVTILRHPVDRWISQFIYKATHHGNPDADREPDRSYIQKQIESEWGDSMGRILQLYFGDDGNGNYSTGQAITTLKRFTLVGDLSRAEDVSRMIQLVSGKKGVRVGRENQSGVRSGLAEIAKEWRSLFDYELRQTVKKRCAGDLEIFKASLHMP